MHELASQTTSMLERHERKIEEKHVAARQFYADYLYYDEEPHGTAAELAKVCRLLHLSATDVNHDFQVVRRARRIEDLLVGIDAQMKSAIKDVTAAELALHVAQSQVHLRERLAAAHANLNMAESARLDLEAARKSALAELNAVTAKAPRVFLGRPRLAARLPVAASQSTKKNGVDTGASPEPNAADCLNDPKLVEPENREAGRDARMLPSS